MHDKAIAQNEKIDLSFILFKRNIIFGIAIK